MLKVPVTSPDKCRVVDVQQSADSTVAEGETGRRVAREERVERGERRGEGRRGERIQER